MKYRNITSGQKISCLTLGGNILGHFCDLRQSRIMIRKALDLGLNSVDTADVYSSGLSEEIIGNSLLGNRSKWFIATKAGIKSRQRPDGLGKREKIQKAAEQSLRRLKTDYIDLYQMHHYDPITPLEETLGALELLVKQGKIRYYGLSNYSCKQMKKIVMLLKGNRYRGLVSLQVHYNLLKREAEEELFPLCRRMDIKILVYGVLARGILAGKYIGNLDYPVGSRARESKSVQNDLTEDVLETILKLKKLAKEMGMTLAQLAIAWVLQRKEAASVIIGVRDIRQLESDCLSVNFKLDDHDLADIDRLIGNRNKFENLILGNGVR